MIPKKLTISMFNVTATIFKDMVESVILLNEEARLIGGGRLRLRLRRARPYRREDNVVPVTDENLLDSSSESKKLVDSKSELIIEGAS
ncbi:unnamed protein product [Schistosoma mattheei]|uniref:Uncharacterized protein n=2 Tax=Schistosoma TaxID=6181 RepID=A0A3P8KMG7_9TREM|nr:unnamed protein product [Schistosoma mattheei]